jgi:hypothetical protein
MSDISLPPVIAGLAIGVAFLVLFSLIFTGTPTEPIMYLTTADGENYKAYNNVYCGESCDVRAYARVMPRDTPTIHIDKESDFGLRTTSLKQPVGVGFILVDLVTGSSSSSTFSLPMRNGNHFAGSLESGEYILSVIAEWDNEQPIMSRSLHQFKVVISE